MQWRKLISKLSVRKLKNIITSLGGNQIEIQQSDWQGIVEKPELLHTSSTVASKETND